MDKKPKLIVLAGPTSSGKTDMAIELAKLFDGEIVSADSRQVYIGMDIGSGKATKEQQQGIPHYLLDVADPRERFTLSDFKRMADEAISDITARGKVPFLVGGTGLYIQAVVDNFQIPSDSIDTTYRTQLEAMDLSDLTDMLKEQDPDSYAQIDLRNKRRVVRALEVLRQTGESFIQQKQIGEPQYDVLMLAIDVPREELYRRIDQRVDDRMQEGMIDEVKGLLAQGVSYEQLYAFGQEYRMCAQYLNGEWKSKEEMITRLTFAIHDFARRQLTWFRKDSRYHWIKSLEEAKVLIESWTNPVL